MRRVFLIVLDSFGIGYEPDAAEFGDVGANTLASIAKSEKFNVPTMQSMGLFNIDDVKVGKSVSLPIGAFGRLQEKSKGKDTTIGHWEISGMVSEKPLPVFPEGFPQWVIEEFEKRTGRKVLCNKPYSGTQVIADYGKEHMETGALIVYTSADSVFQIAAHEEIVPIEELYRYCEIARELLVGDVGVGRVIARPFIGEAPNFTRTARRHDYSLVPPKNTMLDALKNAGFETRAVGKIYDIFAGKGVSEHIFTSGNTDGMAKSLEYAKKDFEGLCFINLVDFDMTFGHRRDVDGYANAATEFDEWLSEFITKLKEEDVVMITADHGCDPGFTGTDHTREYIPLLMYGSKIKSGINIGTRHSFSDIAATILDIFGVKDAIDGVSFKSEVWKNND